MHNVLRVLKLRQAALRVTGAKIERGLDLTRSDPRLRDLFTYHQAHTGRWSSRRMQLHNLPRGIAGLNYDLLVAEPTLANVDAEAERLGCSADDIIASLIRPTLVGIGAVGDYAQVEARMVAWMADDEAMLAAFAGDPYVELGKRLWSEVTKERRQIAKVVFLGCLASGTPILTDVGWVAIQDVKPYHLLWDGEEWVAHGGVVCTGTKECHTISGVTMSANHEILTDDGWIRADELGSTGHSLSGRYSADGRFYVSSPVGKGKDTTVLSADANVDETSRSPETTCNEGSRGPAAYVRCGGRLRSIPTPPTWTHRYESGYSTESAPLSADAPTHEIDRGSGMADGASQSILSGPRIAGPFLSICSDWMVTTTVASTSIESIMTAAMCRVTYDSSPTPKTWRIGAEPRVTYDILNAGPRNRFQAGSLIVHNSIYGMSARKFGEYCALRRIDLEAANLTSAAAIGGFRDAYPQVPLMWRAFDAAARKAIGGEVAEAGRCRFDAIDGALRLTLPSGRSIYYRQARIEMRPSKWDGKMREAIVYNGPHGERVTYGSSLVENASQATCRDILADALIRCEDAGLRPVAHVHDEIIVEGSADDLQRIMSVGPQWADGFPLKVEVHSCERYVK